MQRVTVYLCVFGIGGLFWATAPHLRPGTSTAAESRATADLNRHVGYDPNLPDKTVRFFEDRVKQDPSGAINASMLAGSYLNRFGETGDADDLIRAENSARRSLLLRTANNGPAYLALAKSLMGQHRFTEALAAADGLAARSGDPTQADYLRAECRMETGDYAGAGRALSSAANRHDDDPYGKALRARLSEIVGAPERALKLYQEAKEKAVASYETPRPTVAWFCARYANCLASEGRVDEAEEAYREALSWWDRDGRSMTALGKLRAARGDWAEALTWAEKANRAIPTQDAAMLLYDAYRETGKNPDAEKQLRLLTDGGSSLHAHTRLLALFYNDHEMRPEESLALMRSEAERRGKEVYTQDALAWACLKAGKLDEADTAIHRALAMGTKDALLYYHAGRIALARGDSETARAYLEKALATNPYFHPTAPAEAQTLLTSLKETEKQ